MNDFGFTLLWSSMSWTRRDTATSFCHNRSGLCATIWPWRAAPVPCCSQMSRGDRIPHSASSTPRLTRSFQARSIAHRGLSEL